jgi:hypothetical protein
LPHSPIVQGRSFTGWLASYHGHSSSNSLVTPHLTSSQQLIMPLLPSTLPFWFHLLIELPASINFFLNPSEQLSSPAPQSHTIIRQYAVLLLVSALIALIFAFRPIDKTSRNVAGALSLYHLAPVTRAGSRILEGSRGYGNGLGGPATHLIVHTICFAGLVSIFLSRTKEHEKSKADA